MSPEKLIKINGARPSPLKINKESKTIRKPSDHHHHQQQQHHQPVIIYTHSPKIIHTQARDFMALVQRLTGMSRNDNRKTTPSVQGSRLPVVSNSSSEEEKSDNNESSSVLTDEINCGGTVSLLNPCFADIPLFTPSASTDFNFFCSPRPTFRFPDTTSSSPNLGSSSLSPSFLEFMKGLPEY